MGKDGDDPNRMQMKGLKQLKYRRLCFEAYLNVRLLTGIDFEKHFDIHAQVQLTTA